MNALELRRRTLGKGVYKKTVEGNPAIAQGSLARRYPGITMQGWTEQKSYEGRNLLDASQILNLDNGTNTPEEYTVSENTIIAKRADGTVNQMAIQINAILKAGAYYCSYDGGELTTKTGEVHQITSLTQSEIIEKQSGENLTPFGVANAPNTYGSFTLEQDSEVYWNISVIYERGSLTEVKIYGLRIAREVNTPWEPYTGGQPSPSPDYPQEITNAGKYDEGTGKYQYQVKLTGANLFDYTDMLKEDGYVHSNFQKSGAISIKPFHVEQGKQYLLITKGSTVVTMDYSSIYFGQDDLEYIPGGTSIKVLGTSGYSAFWYDKEKRILLTASRTCEITKCMVHGAGLSERYQVEEFGLLEYTGDINIPYEPYRTPQTVTLTSDRPLTKWDRLEKRDGVWGWVYKSAEVVLDGSEDEAWSNYPNFNGFLCSGVLDAIYSRSAGMCNQGAVNQDGSIGIPNTIWLGSNTNTVYFINNSYYNSDLEDEGLQNLKNHLAQSPAIIWYETAEETFVPLSESEQEALNALHTYYPTTVLSNDTECEMTLTYKTKKYLEVTD